jgi:biopolymer transport protein ExbB/TolQ
MEILLGAFLFLMIGLAILLGVRYVESDRAFQEAQKDIQKLQQRCLAMEQCIREGAGTALIRYMRHEISELEDELAKGQDPKVVRDRMRRLLSGERG